MPKRKTKKAASTIPIESSYASEGPSDTPTPLHDAANAIPYLAATPPPLLSTKTTKAPAL